MGKFRGRTVLRAAIGGVALIVALIATVGAGRASGPGSLHGGMTIVTGRDNLAERERGTRSVLAEVLARLVGDPAAGALADPLDAAALEAMVAERHYRDRKEGIQISDEQGTRDRSFELSVEFTPDAVEALLARHGRRAWLGARPRLRVRLTVVDGAATFIVTETSRLGWGQREVMASVGTRTGIALLPPPESDVMGLGGADGLVIGHMSVTPDGYWRTAWKVEVAGHEQGFELEPTTYDRAIEAMAWRIAAALAERDRR